MPALYPKQFIQTVYIDELGTLITSHPYIAFITIGIGLEFLGKCIDRQEQDWNRHRRSKENFDNAIKELDALKPYRQYVDSYQLYYAFRCGLIHASVPKAGITLSSKDQAPNLSINDGKLNLKIEDFYEDFQKACNEVIKMDFDPQNKMNSPILEVPNPNPDRSFPYSGSSAHG